MYSSINHLTHMTRSKNFDYFSHFYPIERSSGSNTFSRMKSRNRLRPGPSQMSIASYAADFKNPTQVSFKL